MPRDHDALDVRRHVVGVLLRPVHLTPVEADGERPVAAGVDILRIVEHDVVHLADVDGVVCRPERGDIGQFGRRVVVAGDVLHGHVVVVVADGVEGLDRHAPAFADVDEIGQRRLVGVGPVRLLRHVAQIHAVDRHACGQGFDVVAQRFEVGAAERRGVQFALRGTDRRRGRRCGLDHRPVADMHVGRHDHNVAVVVHLFQREVVPLHLLHARGSGDPAVEAGDEPARGFDLVTRRDGQVDQFRLVGRRAQPVGPLFVRARHVHAVGHDDALHGGAGARHDPAHGGFRVDLRPVDAVVGRRGRIDGFFLFSGIVARTRTAYAAGGYCEQGGQ